MAIFQTQCIHEELHNATVQQRWPVHPHVMSEIVFVFKDITQLNFIFQHWITNFSINQIPTDVFNEQNKPIKFAAFSTGEVQELPVMSPSLSLTACMKKRNWQCSAAFQTLDGGFKGCEEADGMLFNRAVQQDQGVGHGEVNMMRNYLGSFILFFQLRHVLTSGRQRSQIPWAPSVTLPNKPKPSSMKFIMTGAMLNPTSLSFSSWASFAE